MNVLGPGVRVMLIGSDGYMPPVGTRGVIISEFDSDGDCDVLFPGFPCPNPPGTSWVAHRSWLAPLGDEGEHHALLKSASIAKLNIGYRFPTS